MCDPLRLRAEVAGVHPTGHYRDASGGCGADVGAEYLPEDAGSCVTTAALDRAHSRRAHTRSSSTLELRSSPRLWHNKHMSNVSSSARSGRIEKPATIDLYPTRSTSLPYSDFEIVDEKSSPERRRTSPMHDLPSPMGSPAAPVIEDEPSFTRSHGRRTEPNKSMLHSCQCSNEACIRSRDKLHEAMHANRTWEKHSKGLQDLLLAAQNEKEELRERLHLRLQRSDCGAEAGDEELRPQLKAAKQSIHELKSANESLKTKLDCRVATAAQATERSAVEDARLELRAVHLASMEKDAKLAALTKQLEQLGQQYRKEKHDKDLLQGAVVKQQEQLILTRNEATSCQHNFVIATREKDLLMAQLKRISERSHARHQQ